MEIDRGIDHIIDSGSHGRLLHVMSLIGFELILIYLF